MGKLGPKHAFLMVLKPLLKSLLLLSLHMKTTIYEHIGQGVLMLLKGTL